MGVRIESRENNALVKEPCWVCGEEGRPGYREAFVAEPLFAEWRWVCGCCVKAGPEAIRTTLLEQVEDLRLRAAGLEMYADGSIDVPTAED